MSDRTRRPRRGRMPRAPDTDPIAEILKAIVAIRADVDALKQEVFIAQVRDQQLHLRLQRLETGPPKAQELQGGVAAPPDDTGRASGPPGPRHGPPRALPPAARGPRRAPPGPGSAGGPPPAPV
jgi:hypothetical protein